MKKNFLIIALVLAALPLETGPEALETQVIEEAPTPTIALESIVEPPPSTPTPSQTPIPSPTPTEFPYYSDWASERFGVWWEVRCYDQDQWPWDGFRMPEYGLGFCVPGVISKAAWYFETPTDHYGTLSSYAPYIMEANLRYHGFSPRETFGVALMSCAHIGETVWLRVPGVTGWEGPFTVADCSQRNHLYYHMVGMNLAAEIDYRLALEWGIRRADRVDVHLGADPPAAGWEGVSIGPWWVDHALEFEGVPGTKAGTIVGNSEP